MIVGWFCRRPSRPPHPPYPSLPPSLPSSFSFSLSHSLSFALSFDLIADRQVTLARGSTPHTVGPPLRLPPRTDTLSLFRFCLPPFSFSPTTHKHRPMRHKGKLCPNINIITLLYPSSPLYTITLPRSLPRSLPTPSTPATGYQSQSPPNSSPRSAGTTPHCSLPPAPHRPESGFPPVLVMLLNPRLTLVYPHHTYRYDKQNAEPTQGS